MLILALLMCVGVGVVYMVGHHFDLKTKLVALKDKVLSAVHLK